MVRWWVCAYVCVVVVGCRAPPSSAPREPLEPHVMSEAVRSAQADLPCEDPSAELLNQGKLPSGDRFTLAVAGCGLSVGYEVLCTKRACDFRMLGAVQPQEVASPPKGYETPQHVLPAPQR